ncbi:MAG: TonB-dependent receptor [Hyphomonas sp.]
MERSKKKKAYSLLALSLSLGGFPAAYAQSVEDPQEDQSRSAVDVLTQDTVIVTATKKAGGENIQDTSISMVAFDEARLEAYNIQDMSDLSYRIPNVALDGVGSLKGVANFTIRGLGTNSSIASIEPAVGTFVDGVYYGINFGVVFDTFDLEGFEVLRGPQGVLFGRNVTGGAVLLNTTDPTDELTLKAKVGVDSGLRGTGENFTAQGLVSGPLIEGVLSGKLAIYHNKDEGWFKNQIPGVSPGDPFSYKDFGESETTILRGALKLMPYDGTTLVVKYEYGDQEGQGAAGQSHTNGFGVDGQVVNFSRDSFDFSINDLGYSDAQWSSLSAKFDVDVPFGNGTITNIFGYREFEQRSLSDIDSTPLSLFNIIFDTNQEQFSNELRYNGSFFDDRLDVTTGLFYFTQEILYQEGRDLLGGAVAQNGGGIQDQDTVGIFGAIEYNVTEALSLQAGLRWTDETKDAVITNLALNTGNACVVDPVFIRVLPDGTTSTAACIPDFADTFTTSNFSPKIGVGYEVNDVFRLYGHWARSFRAGGFNLRNTSAAAGTQAAFDDEQIDSFEIGFKSEPIRGATFNGAVFFNVLSDMQRETNVPDPNAGVVQVIANTADAEIFGLELDASIPVSDQLLLVGGVGYLDSEYTDILFDISGDGIVDSQDLALDIPRLAPLSANAGIVYSSTIQGVGYATLNVMYSYRDKAAFTDNNAGVLNRADRVDADLTVDFFDSGASISIYGKNLTNDTQIGGDVPLPALLGAQPLGGTFAPLARGRQVGIELEWEF